MCKNHLILGQHLYSELEGRDITLYGGGRVRLKPNRVRYPVYTADQDAVPEERLPYHLVNPELGVHQTHT